MSEKTTGRGLAQDTIESLRHQRNLLGEALGRVLIHYGVIRSDVALTGPELLLAAETAISVDQKPQNSSTDDTASKTMLEELATDATRFDAYTIQAIADAAIRKIARLEGYSDGLAERLRQVRRAAGCNHE